MQTYNPTLLERGLKALFLKSLVAAKPMGLRNLIATEVPSDGASEKYAWAGPPQQMTQVNADDTIDFQGMTDTGYTITNAKYAKGIAVSQDQIDDDQLGGIRMRVMQLAAVGAAHPDKLLTDAVVNGTSSTLGAGYDGVAFFSNSHTGRVSEGTQDNLAAGTGTTTAQVSQDFNDNMATLSLFVGENGEPFRETVTEVTIMAPPALRRPMMEALKGQLYGGGNTNAQIDGLQIKLIFNPRLTADANDWYLFNTGAPIRPLIFQDRAPLTFKAQEDGDIAFTREQYLYKIRARYAAGYAQWQDAIKVVNA